MNIFIKHFYIISILIHLNSSMIVHIHIDKNELIQKGNEFRLRMVKRSEDGTKWELARNANKNSEGKLMKAANYASIIVPLEWEKLYKKSIKDNEPFWLAIKVIITMIDNKSIEIDPLPFILKKDGQHLYIDLTKLENGKIIGSIYEATSSNDGHNRVEQMPAHYGILESSNVSSLPLQNAQNPHGNFMGKSKLPYKNDQNSFTNLHKNNPQQELSAHQQLGRPNYFKDEGKIQQISKEWENANKKRAFSEISDDKPFLVNHSAKHVGPKLLQSSINASNNRQSKKGVKNNSQQELMAKQKLGINKMISPNYPKEKVKIQRILREVENTNKRAFSEIGGNEPQFVKLLQPSDGDGPKLLQSSINASHGQSRNEGQKQQQGNNQSEFTQINPSGFTHHGHHKAIKDEQIFAYCVQRLWQLRSSLKPMNTAGEYIGEGQQNLLIQTAKTSSSSFDAIGGSQHYDGRKGKAPSIIADPLAEQQHFTADDDAEDWSESDLANLFTFDD